MSEVRKVESELHDLRVAIKAFNKLLGDYLAGDAPPEEARTLEAQRRSARNVLLQLANNIADVHGPVNSAALSERAKILWEVQATELAKYGIVPTEDGELFTFAKGEDAD